jgi:hypothetical protein
MLFVYNLDGAAAKWDQVVRSFEKYDVNYLSGYAKAFQIHGEGEPILLYFDDGTTRAMNVVIKRDIAKVDFFREKLALNTWFDHTTPYGYGGFWLEGQDFAKVNETYDTYCKDNGIVSEFVRFHLFSNYESHYSGLTETNTRNIVRDLELPLDEMLMDFEHKVRKNLKKANRAELEVEIDNTGERLDDFLDIYYGTMDRTGANDNFFFGEEFFKTLHEMKGNFVYIHTLHKQKVISSELVLYGTENCYSFLGGTNEDYFHLRPNDFLKYEIIKWAKTKGLKRFILGGGYGSDDGIFKYKKSFAPNGVCNFYIGKKIFNNQKYQQLVKMRKSGGLFIKTNTFFPQYRASYFNS